MIKIGIIGTGFMGSAHASCYEELEGKFDFKVTAVADASLDNAKKLAERFNAQAFEGGISLIENADVNTIDICLPTYLHASHMILAMQKGYNVIVEKPLCINEAEAAELIKVQAQTGANVMVAQCVRFWDEYAYLKKLVTSGEFGEFISGVFTRISPMPNWYWSGWGHDKNKSGSAVLDMHIHDVDFVRYILGMPTYTKAEIINSPHNGNPEHIFALYRYDDKVISIEGGWDYPKVFPFEMAYRAKFEKATVVYSSAQSPTLKIYTEDGEVITPEFKCESKNGSGYYNELKYFLECIASNRKIENASLVDAAESFYLAMKVINQA